MESLQPKSMNILRHQEANDKIEIDSDWCQLI